MAKILSEEEVFRWRDMTQPQADARKLLDAVFNAHLDRLLDSHEELRRRLDAAITRLSAEADCLAYEYDYEKWLMDIIKDLSFDAMVENLVKNAIVEDASRDESKT